jgi:spore maturation protein CgeB
MKILYTVSTPYGLGADRWIYQGYKNAFTVKSHNCSPLTENENFEERVGEFKPDLLILDFVLFEKHFKNKEALIFLENTQKQNTKIFCQLALDDRSEQRVSFIRECAPFINIFYSSYVPEINHGFEQLIGKPLYFIPYAADSNVYFSEKPQENFSCDIAFVGSFYTAKRKAFKQLLYPLTKKYKVRVYGPGWSVKDKILRLGSGFSRKLKINWLVAFINKQRLSFSSDDERNLYSSAKICINIHEYFENGKIKGFSNEREFKIPASGGFQISDYVPGMECYFKLNKEIVVAKNRDEWFSKIDYYLSHDKERRIIQKNGTESVLKNHTYQNRVDQIVSLYENLTKTNKLIKINACKV